MNTWSYRRSSSPPLRRPNWCRRNTRLCWNKPARSWLPNMFSARRWKRRSDNTEGGCCHITGINPEAVKWGVDRYDRLLCPGLQPGPPSQTPGGVGQRYWSVIEVTWPPKLELRRWESSGPSSVMSCTQPLRDDVRGLTHWALGDLNEVLESNFQDDLRDWWLRYRLWNCSQMNITGPHWW